MNQRRTTKLEGNDARNYMAVMAAVHCANQREAYRLLRNAEGDYKRALATELKRFNFKIPKHAKQDL